MTDETWYDVEWFDPEFGWQKTQHNTIEEVRDFMKSKVDKGVNKWTIKQKGA